MKKRARPPSDKAVLAGSCTQQAQLGRECMKNGEKGKHEMYWRGERWIECRGHKDVAVRVKREVKRKSEQGREHQRVRGGIIKYFLCV